MYVRWKRRPVYGGRDVSLQAVLVRSSWQPGQRQARQHLVGYLGSIRERYQAAPAHRLLFWQQAEQHLSALPLDPATRQRLEARLAARVPRLTSTEQQEVLRQQAWVVQLAALLRPRASP